MTKWVKVVGIITVLIVVGVLVVRNGFALKQPPNGPSIASPRTAPFQRDISGTTTRTSVIITIDQSTLNTTSSHPIIAGTATGVSDILVILRVRSGSFSGYSAVGTAEVPVKDGRWLLDFANATWMPGSTTALVPGIYYVDAIADADHQAVGTLTVEDMANSQ